LNLELSVELSLRISAGMVILAMAFLRFRQEREGARCHHGISPANAAASVVDSAAIDMVGGDDVALSWRPRLQFPGLGSSSQAAG